MICRWHLSHWEILTNGVAETEVPPSTLHLININDHQISDIFPHKQLSNIPWKDIKIITNMYWGPKSDFCHASTCLFLEIKTAQLSKKITAPTANENHQIISATCYKDFSSFHDLSSKLKVDLMVLITVGAVMILASCISRQRAEVTC